MTIKLLTQDIINKVAAGEVIDGPAAVVKELIENALDANAKHIKIELEDYGFKTLVVTDDGTGMVKEDVLVCCAQHTTSKVYTLDDFYSITTLGFRGEALHSISVVAKLTVKSRPATALAGHQVDYADGNFVGQTPVGMPLGTQVLVKDLFYNIPGRLKAHTNKALDYKKILAVLTNYALAKPTVSFMLNHNKKVVVNLAQTTKYLQRATDLLGPSVTNQLLEVKTTRGDLAIAGFISRPQLAFLTPEHQHFFVNARAVDDKTFSKLVKTSYGSLLEHKTYPAVILFVTLPPNLIDVNMHPQKEHIQFLNSSETYTVLNETLTATLAKNNLAYGSNASQTDLGYPTNFYATDIFGKKANKTLLKTLKENTATWNIKTNNQELLEDFILQINNLYLAYPAPTGLILIDQHAAHEKILYEEFVEAFKAKRAKLDCVKLTKLVELPLMYHDVVASNLSLLKKLGFELEFFDTKTLRITAIPKLFENHDVAMLLTEFAQDLLDAKTDLTTKADYTSLKTISYLACRTAIKAGEYLTQTERKNLVQKVQATKSAYTCPHGRPLKLELSTKLLGRLFKRGG